MVTKDHLFSGVIGVEDDNPTDISLNIGYATRISEQSDFNIDGDVNMEDFAVLAGSWMLADGDVGYNDRCDLSDDDAIDANDLAVFSADWLGIEND